MARGSALPSRLSVVLAVLILIRTTLSGELG